MHFATDFEGLLLETGATTGLLQNRLLQYRSLDMCSFHSVFLKAALMAQHIVIKQARSIL